MQLFKVYTFLQTFLSPHTMPKIALWLENICDSLLDRWTDYYYYYFFVQVFTRKAANELYEVSHYSLS
jgi:hypothetical protein